MLKSLAASNVRFAVFGGAGLALITGDRSRELPDSDVILAPGEVHNFVRWALTRGEVTVWGEKWRDDLALEGKLYVRATIDGLLLDAVFEDHEYDYEELVRRATSIDGIPVCPEEELRAMRARPRT
ncbi:MAG: hypothetical protein ACO1OB_01540 [Archangium sp.]